MNTMFLDDSVPFHTFHNVRLQDDYNGDDNDEVMLGLAFFTPSADFQQEDDSFSTRLSIKLNLLAAWWSLDSRCENKRFSHVELLLDNGYSYSIKIGSSVTKTWRNYKDRNLYGFLNVAVSKKCMQKVRNICERKVEESNHFSYLSIFFNFILPTWARCCFKNDDYAYKTKDGTFCSKFVTEMLKVTGVLDDTVIPDLTSPNNLWAELLQWAEFGDNYKKIINTTEPAYNGFRKKAEEMAKYITSYKSKNDTNLINLL